MKEDTDDEQDAWCRYRMLRFLLLSWLVLVMGFAGLWWLGNSWIPWPQRWLGALFGGLILGSVQLMVLGFPWFILSYVALLWRKVRIVKVAWLVMGLPVMLCLGWNIRMGLRLSLPQYQQERFEKITGKPWPQGARLLTSRHSFLAADGKHIWFFESQPDVYDSFIRKGDWSSLDGEDILWESHLYPRFPWEAVPETFPASWQATEFWGWDAPKEAEFGPFGPAYLLTDSQRQYWCLRWDGF